MKRISLKTFLGIMLSATLFILNPLLGIILTTACFYISKKQAFLSFLIIQASIFLGLINMTKLLESDLLFYSWQFSLADNSSFFAYLKEMKKDGAFYGIFFFLNKIFSENFKFAILTLTFFSYNYFLRSLSLYFKKVGSSVFDIIFALYIGIFFFEIFSLSAHLIRQFFAFSLILYFIVNRLYYQKSYWLVLLVSIFSHTTMLIFLPIIFLPIFKNRIDEKKILVGLIIYFLIINFYRPTAILLMEYVEPDNILGYVLERTTKENIVSEGIKTVPLIVIVFNFIVLMMTAMELYVFKNTKSSHLYNIIIVISLLVLATWNAHPLLSLRYGYLGYSFIIFILPLAISRKRIGSMGFLISFFLMAVLMLRFFIKIDNGVWQYISSYEILYYTVFNYIS
jgi:hypothetical protein